MIADRPAKMTFHCLGTPGLAEALARAGVRHVTLAGIEAHVCVAQTALELLKLGYRVQVAADAVGSRYATDREFALRRLETAGAVVTTAEAALFEWTETAEHPPVQGDQRAGQGTALICGHDRREIVPERDRRRRREQVGFVPTQAQVGLNLGGNEKSPKTRKKGLPRADFARVSGLGGGSGFPLEGRSLGLVSGTGEGVGRGFLVGQGRR